MLRNNANTKNTQHQQARAFSLIEILIAVLILAVGLLGLGAVFPVVLNAQKRATDTTLGASAARSVQSTVRAWVETSARRTNNVWKSSRDLLEDFDPDAGQNNQNVSRWYVPDYNLNTGEFAVGAGLPGITALRVPVSQRLFPFGLSGEANAIPTFVWDIAVRRVPDADNHGFRTINNRVPRRPYTNIDTVALNDELEFAIFVRRLDPRLRPPAGQSLIESLSRPTPTRLPVSVDNNGLPTNDGQGNYAQPLVIDIDFNANSANGARNQLRVTGPVNRADVRAISQIGQRFADNLGNVYTVNAVERVGNTSILTVTPPVPLGVMPTGTNNAPQQITNVVVTPQVAAWIGTFRVRP